MLLAGCAGNDAESTRYYMLPYVGEADSGGADAEGHAGVVLDEVRVEEVKVAQAYDRRQLVERLSVTEVNYLSQHLWAVSLPEAVGEVVYDALIASGLVGEVYHWHTRSEPRYVVSTRVEALELVRGDGAGGFPAGNGGNAGNATDSDAGPGPDNQDTPGVHLEIDIVLVDQSTDSVILRHAGNYRRKLPAAGPGVFVERVTALLTAHVDEFLSKLSEAEF
jgi:hypothetical protein